MTPRRRHSWGRAILAGVLSLFLAIAWGHEVHDNRATLVLRDSTHLAMTLRVDLAQALRRELAPASAPQAFLLELVSMAPDAFARHLRRAQARFESGSRLLLADGRELAFSNWVWPDPARLQAALRDQVMQAVVAPGAHPADPTHEVRADLASRTGLEASRLKLPAAFDRVLLVWYRPRQAWVAPGGPSEPIRF